MSIEWSGDFDEQFNSARAYAMDKCETCGHEQSGYPEGYCECLVGSFVDVDICRCEAPIHSDAVAWKAACDREHVHAQADVMDSGRATEIRYVKGDAARGTYDPLTGDALQDPLTGRWPGHDEISGAKLYEHGPEYWRRFARNAEAARRDVWWLTKSPEDAVLLPDNTARAGWAFTEGCVCSECEHGRAEKQRQMNTARAGSGIPNASWVRGDIYQAERKARLEAEAEVERIKMDILYVSPEAVMRVVENAGLGCDLGNPPSGMGIIDLIGNLAVGLKAERKARMEAEAALVGIEGLIQLLDKLHREYDLYLKGVQ